MTETKTNRKENALPKGNVLPARVRCKVGGEWKPLAAFSQNQLKHLHKGAQYHGKMDAANSGMTCLEHATTGRPQLRCELCSLVKSIDDFSKTARRSDEPLCKRCTAWCEVQEPGMTPFPLETGHRSFEEDETDIQWQEFANVGGSASSVISSKLSEANTDENWTSQFGGSSSTARSLPPNLQRMVDARHKRSEPDTDGNGTSQSGESNSTARSLPPYLQRMLDARSKASSTGPSSAGETSQPSTRKIDPKIDGQRRKNDLW